MVLGGSEVYTGAPYYAASAALHTGADDKKRKINEINPNAILGKQKDEL